MKKLIAFLFITLQLFSFGQISSPRRLLAFSSALPEVTTTIASNPVSTSINLGGNVTSDGGYSVTARGVVVGTSTSPTITTYTFKTSGGTGTGTFSNTVTGLSCNTTYYYRAFATNSQGTAYGTEYSFATANPSYLRSIQYYIECADPEGSVSVTSEQTAKDAIDLASQCNGVTEAFYMGKITTSNFANGTVFYSNTTACALGSNNFWGYIQQDGAYYVVHVNSSSTIDTFYQYP